MFTYIVDDEITLKLKEYQDSEALFELIDQSRSHIRQWMTWVNVVESAEDVNKVTRKHLQEFTDRKAIHFIILYKGNVAGSVNIHHLDWKMKSAEIGYWLGDKFTGKGIMLRAVESLLPYLFEELGMHKVEIWSAEGNIKSRSIPERLGFLKEGMRRDDEMIDGNYMNMLIYGLLEDEWRNRK